MGRIVINACWAAANSPAKPYKAMSIWNIKEYTGDGVSCPIMPVVLPWYKQVGLFFFRFGFCPLCVTSSVGYSLWQELRRLSAKIAVEKPN